MCQECQKCIETLESKWWKLRRRNSNLLSINGAKIHAYKKIEKVKFMKCFKILFNNVILRIIITMMVRSHGNL